MGVDVKTMDKETLSYYNTNSNDFIENTLNVDFAEIQNKFMDKLQAKITCLSSMLLMNMVLWLKLQGFMSASSVLWKSM